MVLALRGIFSKKADCLTWGDALFIREHAHAIKVLLTTVINNDLFRDCSYIEGWFSDKAAPWFTEELLRIGFQRIPEPDDLYPGFVFFDKDFSPARMDNDLYYTKGDSDLF